MDAKDLRTQTALSEHKDGSKYSQSGVTLQCNRNKSYQDIGSNPLAKTESAAVRPCAVIGPDRVVPQPASNDAFLKKGSIESWPCSDNVYTQLPPDYQQRIANNQNQMRNISPRQTYQENMQRIMVPPTYNSIKNNNDSSSFNHGERTPVLSKNTKPNMATEAKYCEVPYTVNQLSNEHKNGRDPELCVPSVNSPLMRAIPHGWPTNSANLHGPRSYGAHELYQYQQYQSCAGPRPPVLPMGRPQRTFQDESGYVYPESYYQDPSIRYKPYPQVKERYPQPRFDYISNYSNHFHPPPSTFPPHKYDIPKPPGPIHHYPMYHNLKYLENRTSDPTLEAFQRHPNQPLPSYNMPFRNQTNHPGYPPGLTNAQSKVLSYQVDSSGKPLVSNKMPYDNNNKIYIDYDNARNKPYTMHDTFMVNEINRVQPAKSQILPPTYPTPGMHPVPTQQFFRKEIPMKSHEYLPHFRNFDPSVGGYTMIRHPSQFSPNAFAISPTDSNTSNDTTQTQATNQEDCGYVSQSSTASARSVESGIHRISGDYYRKPEYRYGPVGNSLNTKHEVNKNKKQIDVRQFLQMWNEGDDDNGENNNSKEIVIQTGNSDMNNYSKQQESKQEQLYVLGLVNVPSEELSKYEHIQKVSKLPENIKGYNSIELLKQFEEAIESSNISSFKQPPSKEFHIPMREHRSSTKQVVEVLPRPLSPLDVEAKISQSVIHKEVGCNFEIKPCSPKMLNVEIPAPVQNILGERVIEKVCNPLSLKTKSPIQTDDNVLCRNLKRQEPVINYENSSCKVLSSPFSAHNLDNVKTDYSLQDLETNSGVCLASLPRLDNEIELNFPEVNQQFIDANKIDNISINENNFAGSTQSQINTPEIDCSKSNVNNYQDTENHGILQDSSDKEYSKLSKYRKIKNSLLEISEINVKAVRTDSVIIKNPDNHKRGDNKKHDYTESSLKGSDLNPINLTSHINLKTDNDNFIESTCAQNDMENIDINMAIDFSLNKPEVSSIIEPLKENNTSEKIDSHYKDKDRKEKRSLSTIDSFIAPHIVTETDHKDTNKLDDETVEDSNENILQSLKEPPTESTSLSSPKQTSVEKVESNENRNSSFDEITNLTSDNLNPDLKIEAEMSNTDKNNLDMSITLKTTIDLKLNSPLFIEPKTDSSELSTETQQWVENDIETEILSKSDVKKILNIKNDESSETINENNAMPLEDIQTSDHPACDKNVEQDLCQEPLTIGNNSLITDTSISYDCIPSLLKDCSNNKFDQDMTDCEPFQESESGRQGENQIIYRNNYYYFRKSLFSPQIRNLLFFVEGLIKSSINIDQSLHHALENDEEISESSNINDPKTDEELHNDRIIHVSDQYLNDEKVYITDVEKNANKSDDTSSTAIIDCETTDNIKLVSTIEPISKEDQTVILSSDPQNQLPQNNKNPAISNESLTYVTKITDENSAYGFTTVTESERELNKKDPYDIIESVLETTQSENLKENQEISLQPEKPDVKDDLRNKETENVLELNSVECPSVCDIQLECINETNDNATELPEPISQSSETIIKNETSLKRSFSDSALNSYTQEKIWPSKRRKTNENDLENNIVNENISNFIHTTRRNSISSINNDENVSFCILIDNTCLLTPEDEQEKICFAEITENIVSNENEGNIVIENVICPEDDVFTDSTTYEENVKAASQENVSMDEESWVEDIACVETVVCDDIEEEMYVKSLSSPQNGCDETELSEDIAQDVVISSPSYSYSDLNETQERNDIREDVVISTPSYPKSDYMETEINDDITEDMVYSSSPKGDFPETEISEDVAEDVVIGSNSSPGNNFFESQNNEDIEEGVAFNSSSSKDNYISNKVSENIAEAMGLTSPLRDNNYMDSDINKDAINDMCNSYSSTREDFDTEDFKCEDVPYSEIANICSPLSNDVKTSPKLNKVTENTSINSLTYSTNDRLETAISNVINGDLTYHSTPKDYLNSSIDYDLVRDLETGSCSMNRNKFDEMEVSNMTEDMTSSPSASEGDPSEYDEYGLLCNNLYKHTSKIKSMYRESMTDNNPINDTLFKTSQINFNETLKVRDDLVTLFQNEYEGDVSGHKSPQSQESCKLGKKHDNSVEFNSAISKESVRVLNSIQLPKTDASISNNQNVTEFGIPQDNTVNSCETSIENNYTYEDSSYISSSPEVSSTTSEERNSSILLKITNLNGARISQINETKPERKPRCKFTENKDYCNNNFPNRPLITKAAQKYIPPINESIRDLKVKISLPPQSLLKLKQLKLNKSIPKVINKQCNANVPKISKKPKPNFEDVLKSIDEIQIKMHKEKIRKPKTMVPKVVIKKNEYGSHYTSTPCKETFNPDLTGRKWQPWVFLEKNSFIDKMALKNKTQAIFNHRKNTYVLAEKFKKYKSVANSTKFVISQPNSNKYTGQLKYTIRLKHSY